MLDSLSHFFQLGPLPDNQMIGTYDFRIVILSYFLAIFASYVALDITGRLRDITTTQLNTTFWVLGGAFAMGAGIWSMHFIGMLAFQMAMPAMYDPVWTTLSLIVAIGASLFAFILLKSKTIHTVRLMLGGIILGLAIAAMHYTGMTAMTQHVKIHYLPGLFILSVLVAIIASEAALYLAIKSTRVRQTIRFRLKFISAFIMGAAICGMHYIGMAAAIFTPLNTFPDLPSGINPALLAISITITTFIILGVAFIVSIYNESLSQKLLLSARQAGMTEVAISVLHNVGNVLNSINVSSLLIHEKITKSNLSSLVDLKKLMEKYNNDLYALMTKDEAGKHLPELLSSLADYWKNEQEIIAKEIKTLLSNIQHVKTIISTQQDFSKITPSEQSISISEVIEEALLIAGIDHQKHDIHLKQEYMTVPTVIIDKIKLLQILVNLIQNAKESVILNTQQKHKTITLLIKTKNPHFIIQVIDNGTGIAPDNLIRIFSYGFTTKKDGHGFGLHTSAVSAMEMGGTLKASSEGVGKGACFTLELPFKPT